MKKANDAQSSDEGDEEENSDYRTNPDFVTGGGKTIAEMEQRMNALAGQSRDDKDSEDGEGSRDYRTNPDFITGGGKTIAELKRIEASRSRYYDRVLNRSIKSTKRETTRKGKISAARFIRGRGRKKKNVPSRVEQMKIAAMEASSSQNGAHPESSSVVLDVPLSSNNNAPGPPVFIVTNDNEAQTSAGAISVPYAQAIESIHEEENDLLLVSNATPVVPPYQQKRVWAFLVLLCGVSALLGNLFGASENRNSMENVMSTLPPMSPSSILPSASVMPSSSVMPTTFPSIIPTERPSSAHSTSPTSNEYLQQKALVDFYNALAGDNWIEDSRWNSAISSMCRWHGIDCDTDGSVIFVKDLILPANNLKGNIDNITLFSNLRYLERLDLDSNAITGNLTAFSKTLASLSNLTHVDLRLNELTGSIPTEVCESIGNGTLRVDCAIKCDCCNHDELCGDECVDVPGWHDSDGDDCAWYGVGNNCEIYGTLNGNDGPTANTACCACGGGKKGFKSSPSSAPSTSPETPSQQPTVSMRPTKSPSKMPSQQPSTSPEMPSQQPTVSIWPTQSPSKLSSQQPTISMRPNISVVIVAVNPSNMPSQQPTLLIQQTYSPSKMPSQQPTFFMRPTHLPSVSQKPSKVPSQQPTVFMRSTYLPSVSPNPSKVPSQQPTVFMRATYLPSVSQSPSKLPSQQPTVSIRPTQSLSVSQYPSKMPSQQPTVFMRPIYSPSVSQSPSKVPSQQPTVSMRPTQSPSVLQSPSRLPSQQPTVFMLQTNLPSVSQNPSKVPS